MPEDKLIEPIGVQEVFVDGFTKHVARDGVMSCVGFRRSADGKVVVIKLVWPAVNTEEAIDDANGALATHEINGVKRGLH